MDSHNFWIQEKALVDFLLPYVPARLETYHLTLLTLVWSFLAVLSWYLAYFTANPQWLWRLFAAIVLQYFSDLLDGAVWRARDTGLVLWWFYMDHLLDYIFLISVFVAWWFVIPPELFVQFVLLVVVANVLFFHVFVSIPVTQVFSISFNKIWPTEYRMLACLTIIWLIYFPTVLYYLSPILLVILIASCIFMIYSTQKKLWDKDMENKNN